MQLPNVELANKAEYELVCENGRKWIWMENDLNFH